MTDIEASRAYASDRLREAWSQGRIDAAEHERRTTALRHATSIEEVEAAERGDVRPVGADGNAGVSPIPPLEERPEPGATAAEVEKRPERTPGILSLPPTLGGTLVGLTPFIAVILFFTGAGGDAFPSWIWFLLIPIMGMLVYGPDGKSDD